MTHIGVVTSPLQAAREWRGVSLIVAARNSGLTVGQAEALEEGRIDGFTSVDEMVAVAVLYGASLGIGRDEAMALLDRTIASLRAGGGDTETGVSPAGALAYAGATVVDPTPTVPVAIGNAAFSQAVRTRSAVIGGTIPTPGSTPALAAGVPVTLAASGFANIPAPRMQLPHMPYSPALTAAGGAGAAGTSKIARPPSLTELAATAAAMRAAAASASPIAGTTGELPALAGAQVAHQPSEAVRAALALDPGYRAAWAQASSELETWASGHTGTGRAPGGTILARIMRGMDARLEGIVGARRVERLAHARASTATTMRDLVVGLRARLEQSEHATLLVALAGGVVLIALLIAVASALDSGTQPAAPETGKGGLSATLNAPQIQQPPMAKNEVAGTQAGSKATGKQATPMLKPRQIHLRVLNAGGESGLAHQVAEKLRKLGYTIDEVGNSKTAYATSVVLFPRALQREALRLSRQTKVTTMDTTPNTGAATQPTMTIVLR